MVDDHRQEVAELIKWWAYDEGGAILDAFKPMTHGAIFRLADTIVSNHCELDDAHMWGATDD